MSLFRPTRTSPPSKLVTLPGHSSQTNHSVDISHSSTASAAELIGLSQNEIEILDAVIKRADPSATTFKSIFKPYNDVLVERGVDPQEVLYYKKLLKLGTMKGKNWADKWNMVKKQNGYQGEDSPIGVRVSPYINKPTPKDALNRAPRRVIPRAKPSLFTEVSSTLGSDETETTTQTEEHGLPRHHIARPLSRQLNRTEVFDSKTGIEDSKSYSLLSAPQRRISPRTTQPRWDVDASDGTGDTPYTTPPSYRASTQDSRLSKVVLHSVRTPTYSTTPDPPSIVVSSATARKVVAMARERKGSVVNEEDAWNKIRMQRDEKDADDFRADRIMERCWEVWKQGFLWIVTTNQQISEARDNLLLRLSLQRWQTVMASRKELYTRIGGLSDKRHLKRSLAIWRNKLREAQQSKWRHTMRLKMKTIKDKRELKLRKDAWAKWRQSYRSHLSDQRYEDGLRIRLYNRWKARLSALDALETVADDVLSATDYRRVIDCWQRWRKTSKMESSAQAMIERINWREIADAMDLWRRHAQDRYIAKKFNQLLLMRAVIRTWKVSQDRIKAMENRATKHVTRQDGVLLRAVSRVWKARERGKLLQRVKTVRLLKDTWEAWKQRVRHQKRNEELAVSFSLRANSNTTVVAFRSWHEVHVTHRNAHSFAVDYHSAQLRYALLLSWRLKLRDKLNLTKMARRADSYFAARRAYKLWCSAFESRTREKALKDLERRQVVKIFRKWLNRAQCERQRRLAEEVIKDQVTKRILENALSHWTNRVIEIKLRELEIGQQREARLQTLALKKWREACARHAEELSLMESYQLVKREESIRRMFYRWSSIARTHRHRRITLQKKEDEMKLSMIASAWDRWRDRFSDERLRPIEYGVIIQTQKNLIFRAFGIWHSKTKSLPAIRFHATNAKAKYFEIWQRGMPRALQAKQAREIDRKATLSKHMAQWVESHRTKMALKAVARARYLRLPTAAPRQIGATTRAVASTAPLNNRNIFPRRVMQGDMDTEDSGPSRPSPSPPPRPFRARTTLAEYPRTKTSSETGFPSSKPSPPKARDPSPARSRSSFNGYRLPRETSPTRSALGAPSSASGEAGRSKLWLELRDVQRKSRPSSQYSKP